MMARASIPYLLIFFRFCLVLLLPLIAYFHGPASGKLLALLVFLGALSDFFDGVIARRLNIATDKLRRLDSQTDALFWLAVLVSIYLIHPQLIIANLSTIIILVAMESCCYLLSFIKFRRETCTHSYMSKLWGLTLLFAFVDMLGFGRAGILWDICFITGLISQIEVILILLILPAWHRDIKTAYHAWRLARLSGN